MTRMSKSDTLLATAELRAGSVITEGEINCLKRRWAPHGRHNSTAYAECVEFFTHGPYRISEEQAAKGLAYWLAKCMTKCMTKRGERRNNAFTRANMRGETTWYVLGNFSHFELVYFEFESNGYFQFPYPVYRMHSTAGTYVDYIGKRVWGEDQTIIV